MDRALELIESGIDTKPLMDEISEQSWLWNVIKERQTTKGSPHHDTETIFLRWCPGSTLEDIFTQIEAVDCPPLLSYLPSARGLMETVCELVNSRQLGRAMIVRFKPGGRIDPHIDEGQYADYFDRFHLSLDSQEGNRFNVIEDEHNHHWVHMKPGEVWWFNHKMTHFVENHSDEWRTHMIVDCVSPRFRGKRDAA